MYCGVDVADKCHAALCRREFRMEYDMFNSIVDKVGPHMEKQDTNWRAAIPPRTRVAIAIYRLAHGHSYGQIAEHFGVGASTSEVIVSEFCAVLHIHFAKDTIKIPQGQALKDLFNMGSLKNFPGCFGAVDGSHIAIEKPKINGAAYYNRKSFHSTVLSAAVDLNGKFIDIDVGHAGSVHDARVFADSKLSELAEHHYGMNDIVFDADGFQLRPYLLGDPAYPLMPALIKAFPTPRGGQAMAADKFWFNHKLSGVRMCVERAFGRFKGRWRIFSKPLEGKDFRKQCLVIVACCVLHNWCEEGLSNFERLMEQDAEDAAADGGQQPPSMDEASHAQLLYRSSDEYVGGADIGTGLAVRNGLFQFLRRRLDN